MAHGLWFWISQKAWEPTFSFRWFRPRNGKGMYNSIIVNSFFILFLRVWLISSTNLLGDKVPWLRTYSVWCNTIKVTTDCSCNWSNIISAVLLPKVFRSLWFWGESYHRYPPKKSNFISFFKHYVMACLLLASKIEEEPRKPRDVLNVYHRLKQILTHRRSSNSKRTT